MNLPFFSVLTFHLKYRKISKKLDGTNKKEGRAVLPSFLQQS